MKFRPRTSAATILKAAKTFPAVVLSGPRQSGKTTLLRTLFAKTHAFVSLEDPDIRVRAKDDPAGFLAHYKPPVVIDEIQYLPELLSYIKTRIDADRKPGQWLLTGSQNFTLMHGVTQSLAGRAAVLSLLPFSVAERLGQGESGQDVSRWIAKASTADSCRKALSLPDVLLRGFYPQIASDKAVDRQLWCGSYITTYLERDVRNLSNIGDLGQFERFLVACATRSGQILNISEIARDIGISVPTAKRWLSLLQTGYQVFLLYPYYKNIGKRIIKSPKLYFSDPALCSYLLGLHDHRTLAGSPSLGNLFETMIVSDVLKRFLNFGQRPSMYYLRSRDDLEVDLVIELGGRIHLYEIKSTMTITSKHAFSLKRIKDEFGPRAGTAAIISCAEGNFPVSGDIMNYNWKNMLNQ